MQVEKGKLHGCIDVGLSVMAIKKKAKCIDLDAEENIYHLKVSHQLWYFTDLRMFCGHRKSIRLMDTVILLQFYWNILCDEGIVDLLYPK